jgi:breast cancer 2 susceptibility protein
MASLVRAFPKLLRSFTPNEVLRQLLARYTAECDGCRRSALRKIIERDDIPSRPTVLIVGRVFSSCEVEVSDGWYSMKALLDPPLSSLVKDGKIREGVKIISVGATVHWNAPSQLVVTGRRHPAIRRNRLTDKIDAELQWR